MPRRHSYLVRLSADKSDVTELERQSILPAGNHLSDALTAAEQLCGAGTAINSLPSGHGSPPLETPNNDQGHPGDDIMEIRRWAGIMAIMSIPPEPISPAQVSEVMLALLWRIIGTGSAATAAVSGQPP